VRSRDATDAFISGAVVIVTNRATDLTRQGVTDNAGHFNLADLPAGV
jgi:hypothetical protein